MCKLAKEKCNYLDIARMLGIFFVVYGHFLFFYPYGMINDLIFSFHMPLFFMISGILHQKSILSVGSFKKLSISLIIPYLIYNGLCILFQGFLHGWGGIWDEIINSIFVTHNSASVASWFFLALFWVKASTLFFKKNVQLIIFSIICLGIVGLFKLFRVEFQYQNIFMIQSAMLAFPFFAFGILVKRFLERDLSQLKRILLVVLFTVINIVVTLQFGSLDLSSLKYTNIVCLLTTALSGSLAVILLGQFLAKYISFTFIKDISRGTMLIVGLHMLIMIDVYPSLLYKPHMPHKNLVLALSLLLLFYFLIKLTYHRTPILYGKQKSKNKGYEKT